MIAIINKVLSWFVIVNQAKLFVKLKKDYKYFSEEEIQVHRD